MARGGRRVVVSRRMKRSPHKILRKEKLNEGRRMVSPPEYTPGKSFT